MIWAFIQARVQSTRFPGKIQYPIQGVPMLGQVLSRVRRIPEVSQVAVLTTTERADDWVQDYCQQTGETPCVRGPRGDVLGRFALAMDALGLQSTDLIVRFTADCPVLDPAVSRRVVQAMLERSVDYVANIRDWPDGLDTEVFTMTALLRAAGNAWTVEDREHVTPWIRRHLSCVEYPLTPPQRHLKWSVDTESELAYVRELYRKLGPTFIWQDILALDLH